MLKKQFYDIKASFLVPAYNLPSGINSWFITTQTGRHDKGSILIDVWMIRALKDNPVQSMLASLKTEAAIYQTELEKAKTEAKTTENAEKVCRLEHGTKVFSGLITEANDPVYHKQPDEQFLDIARNNFRHPSFADKQPDLKNYLYLAGLSHYDER
ncbi:MAG: hypothetical protein J5742_03570 [Alphaproteobacteria bacterium]|nr:hypothetical protein [Alphaproteobacteria bacterium]